MEETVEIIVVSALLVTLVTVTSWIIGSIGCALAGIRPGFFARVGMGLLGQVAFAFAFVGTVLGADYEIHLPGWLAWVGPVACVTGLVLLVRTLRSSTSTPSRADAREPTPPTD